MTPTESNHDDENNKPLECCFTERQAEEFMNQLLLRVSPTPLQDDKEEDLDENFIVLTNTTSTTAITDGSSNDTGTGGVISSSTACHYQYATIEHLRQSLVTYLNKVKGRCTTAQAAAALGLSSPSSLLQQQAIIDSKRRDDDDGNLLTRILFDEKWLHTNQIIVVQDDKLSSSLPDDHHRKSLVTETYLNDAAAAVYKRLVNNHNGCVPISEVAKKYLLSVETCRSLLSSRLVSLSSKKAQQQPENRNTEKDHAKTVVLEKRNANGTLMYVTPQHLSQLQANVCRVLRQKASHDEAHIIHIPDLCRTHDWDVTWILELLSSQSNVANKYDSLPGTFQRGHQDFIPHAYRERQRAAVWQQYQTHGYILTSDSTTSKVAAHVSSNSSTSVLDNLSRQQLWDIIKEFMVQKQQDDNVEHQPENMTENAMLFSDCIINYAVLGVPLEAVLQEAETESSWCELRLPLDLLDICPDNVLEFLQQHVLPRVVVAIDGGGGGNVVKGKKSDNTGTLTLTAERVLYVSGSMVQQIQGYFQDNVVKRSVEAWAAKLLQSSSKGKGSKTEEEFWPQFVTQQVQESISSSNNFVATSSLVECLLQGFEQLQVLPHEGDDGILEKFVTQQFQENEAWQGSILQGIAKECIRREAAASSSVVTAADTALKITSLEDPSCFAAACHMIQMQYKFLEYAMKVGMEGTDTLQEEILNGACRDLVRRLTLFLLGKYGVEERLLTFDVEASHKNDQKQHAKYISSYGTPVDTALRQYPRVLVRYATDDKDDDTDGDADGNQKEQMLAQALTDAVPLQVSQALTELDRAKSVDEFLRLAEENCLTICGIPFRKLDKKSEKSFLAHRKESLTERLQAGRDPGDVLDYAIMLIYQSIKHQTVFGSLIKGPILEQLVQERKISEAVGRALKSLARAVDDKETSYDYEGELIERVRGCGLAKDIAKHSVE